jgi:hypothetical protein
MIRIQTQPDRIDPAEEKKNTRETVLANVAGFALLIVLIRSGKLVSMRISHLPSQKRDYVLGRISDRLPSVLLRNETTKHNLLRVITLLNQGK